MMERMQNDWLLDHINVRVFVAERVTLDQSWRIDLYRPSHWRLYHTDRNGAYVIVNGEEFPLLKDHVYLLPAGMSFQSGTATSVTQFYAHFDVYGLPGLALRRLFQKPVSLAPSPVLLAMIAGASHELTTHLFVSPNKVSVSPSLLCRVKAIIYEGVAQYLESVPEENMEACWQFTRGLESLFPALRKIEEHLQEHLLNPDLAAMCGMSEFAFIRRFRQALGQTPSRYILERRVSDAAQRLMFTDQKLDQIAEQTGFHDRAHLSRVFKEHIGASPAAYRRQQRVSGSFSKWDDLTPVAYKTEPAATTKEQLERNPV